MSREIRVYFKGALEPAIFSGSISSTHDEYIISSGIVTEAKQNVSVFTSIPKTSVNYVQEVVVTDAESKK